MKKLLVLFFGMFINANASDQNNFYEKNRVELEKMLKLELRTMTEEELFRKHIRMAFDSSKMRKKLIAREKTHVDEEDSAECNFADFFDAKYVELQQSVDLPHDKFKSFVSTLSFEVINQIAYDAKTEIFKYKIEAEKAVDEQAAEIKRLKEAIAKKEAEKKEEQ